MSWMKVSFSQTDVKAGKPQQLVQDISLVYVGRPAPTEPVLFRTTGFSGVHDYFVTPEASSLAAQTLSAVGAKECTAPDRASIELL